MSWTDCSVLTTDIADEMALKDNGNGSEGMQKQKAVEVEEMGPEKLRAEKRSTNPEKEHAEETGSGVPEKETVTVVSEPSYSKALTVLVELVGEDRITMMELLRAAKDTCGLVVGCRYIGINKYEITMNHENGKRRLLDGFKIKRTRVMARELTNDEMVVSFIGLPVYITDLEILKKLFDWGVRAISPITRRMWPGTRVVEGTRFVKVKFTDTVKSLPYSTRFDTEMGAQYFRVIHDRQVKVCRMCIQPGHIVRECPEFRCRNCGGQGHYARECDQWEPKCKKCGKKESNCVCKGGEGEEEGIALSTHEDSESEDVGDDGVEGDGEEEGRMEVGFVEGQLSGGLGTNSSPVMVEQTGESVGGEIGSSLDSNMVALTDPANGDLEIRKAKVDARATGGKGSYREPLPPRVVRTNAERRAAMEFETAETVSSQQGEVPAGEPPAMSEGDESEVDDLSVAGGRKRALLNKPGKLAGVMKQTQRKKGKRK